MINIKRLNKNISDYEMTEKQKKTIRKSAQLELQQWVKSWYKNQINNTWNTCQDLECCLKMIIFLKLKINNNGQ